jgi:hypothetical protein
MSDREPGLYPVTWRRAGHIPRKSDDPPWWPPLVLRWTGSDWRHFNWTPLANDNGPDWIGPRLDLPGDAA